MASNKVELFSVMPQRCENVHKRGYEDRSLQIFPSMKAAQLHSSERACSPAPRQPRTAATVKGSLMEGWVMNRQREAEGENASHGQSDDEGVEAEAGSLGAQRAKERKPRAKACGKDEAHSSCLPPSSCLLSEESRAQRMSSEMKEQLSNGTHSNELESGQLVTHMVFISLFLQGYIILCTI